MRNLYHIKLSPMKIAVLDCCDYYNEGMIITRINVPQAFRGQGHARELLRRVCADADLEGVTLWLEISSSDGLDYDQLEAWYVRHGFKPLGGIYRRKPQGTAP